MVLREILLCFDHELLRDILKRADAFVKKLAGVIIKDPLPKRRTVLTVALELLSNE
ncbi:hypothetical protein VU01_11962 [Candidatus Electrothrix marina]|uniref:Uncharacterized protein n=1 Tax=Candidatus Electrothrix marina TaxID=1859130 RepID=A0A444JDL1_9BACT|nr:hypothetical protein VU01_11962 [Candidatus Electrothrix marina]